MFSVIFPGQGSQFIGMGRDFYQNFSYVKEYFNNADEILKKNLSKIILVYLSRICLIWLGEVSCLAIKVCS